MVDEDEKKEFSNIKKAYAFAVIGAGGIVSPFVGVRRCGMSGEVEHGSFELLSDGSVTDRHFEFEKAAADEINYYMNAMICSGQ